MGKLFDKYPAGAALVLMFLCLAPWMALRDVTPSNELRYLSIADEALREGHIFAFTNQGEPYADKPPLYFWLLMLCRLVFGKHCLFVLSLFSFIPAALITLVMDRWVYGNIRDVSPRERSALALMLCTTGYWLALSFFLRMDMLMVLFIVLALNAWHRDRPWLFALFTFLALFTKGPVGILMPPVVILACILSCKRHLPDEPRLHIGRFLGGRFLLLVGGCSAVWFAGAWLDGGADYLHNLLFHQTVDRTVNAFAHKRPFWYYLVFLWPVMLPWCLLTVPAAIASLFRRGDTAAPHSQTGMMEKLFRCAFFIPLVLLSCASGKLPVYLLPVFPFVVYLLPLYIRRTGWKPWMGRSLAVPAALFALAGLALAVLPLTFNRIPALSPYGFAKSPLVSLAGLLLFCGGLWTTIRILRLKDGPAGTRPLSVAILATLLFLSPLLPQANEFLGYRAVCRDVPEGEHVYVQGLRRPESMDVYLGRNVVVLAEGERIPSDGVFIAPAGFNDPVLDGRECRIHGKSALWLPRPSDKLQE